MFIKNLFENGKKKRNMLKISPRSKAPKEAAAELAKGFNINLIQI